MSYDTELPDHLGGHQGITNVDEGVLDWAISRLNISSMLDIGCGPGGMVELANSRGINATGIDGDYTLERYDDSKFIIHDFSTGPVPKLNKYDLAWSVEFVEHVYEDYIPNYMPAFQKCKYVIMTYAPPGTGGHHHVNERPKDYWINRFTYAGFVHIPELSLEMRRSTTMTGINGKKRKFINNTGMVFVQRKLANNFK